MATVPGVLYICDWHGQGGDPGIDTKGAPIQPGNQLLVSDLQKLNSRRVNRFVPDDPDTGQPTGDSLSCWPWYDGNAMSGSPYEVASSSTTTIVVSPSPGWTVNEKAGRTVSVLTHDGIFNGLGFADRFPVVSNTEDTLTFAARPSAPTVGAKFWIGEGRFTDYHAVAGQIYAAEAIGGDISRRGGSSFQAGGRGCGPDATLLRRLLEDVYPNPPYFHFWKYAHLTPIITGWADSPNDSHRALYLAEKVRVDAAAAERGNTIDWETAIIDVSMTDVKAVIDGGVPAVILLYESRLREMIAWLRSSAVTDNPNLKIVLVNHRQDLWNVTGTAGAAHIRGVHRAIAYDTANVALADLEGFLPATSGEAENAEMRYYAVTEYFRVGDVIADTIIRMGLGVAAPPDGGLPTYLICGDSIAVGQVTGVWVSDSSSIEISGPNPSNLIRPANQMIWNRLTQVLETYEPGDNANTSGTLNLLSGPDLSIFAELSKIHPDGYAVIKRASNASALATELVAYTDGTAGGRWMKSVPGEHYEELQADYAACTRYINQTLGKQVDLRGAFVILGANDAQAAGGGAAFAAALRTFCNDLWADFSTRTSGAKFPIIWRRPQKDAAGMIAAEVLAVRDALAVQANRESQFRVVDVDGLERDRADNLHETPETAITVGRRMVAALQRVAI